MIELRGQSSTNVQRVVRVFISSTFGDMHAERDHLITVVFPELRERLDSIGLEFFDVDLRWGIPKTGVDGERANSWKYCKQWIDRVEPFFICILGERYGSRPPQEEILDPEDQIFEGQSVTEMEIRHAVLSGRLRRRSFFYFRDRRVPGNAPTRLYSQFVDAHLQDKLERVKQDILRSKRPVRRYPCTWTGSGFEQLEELGKTVLEDLWSGVLRDERYVPKEIWKNILSADPDQHPLYIDDENPVPEEIWRQLVKETRPEPADPLDMEMQKMASFASSRLLWFRGRENELVKLSEFVERPIAENESRLCLVTGDPGSGKSALLARFSAELSQSRHLVITHFVGATERSAEVQWLLERFNRELDRAKIPAPAGSLLTDQRKRLSQRLNQYNGPQKIVLLIDGVNQLLDGVDLTWVPAKLGKEVRIILSSVEAPPDPSHLAASQVMAALDHRSPKPLPIKMGPLSEKEIHDIVIDYLKEYCKELDAEDIQAICRLDQTKNPLYLLVMLNLLRTLGGDNIYLLVSPLISNLKKERPNTVRLFDWVLEKLEVFDREAVSLWCTYLRLGRAGMTSKELSDLLARKFGDEGAQNALRIERGLRRYLLWRGKLLDFYHDQLRQAVETRYVKDQDVSACHQDIGRYFLNRYTQEEHALSELPYHLRQGNLHSELYEVVNDEEFRRQRIAIRRSVHDLCGDILHAFDMALQRKEIAQIAHFGFLHAGYSEGRFVKPDILKLHEQNPKMARQEADLFLDRPRFRLLILLALKEAQAGQTALSDEYVREALQIRGVKLPESDRTFLVCAVATLLEGGSLAAVEILERIILPIQAVKEAARIALKISVGPQLLLLEKAIGWLKKNANSVGSETEFVDAFDEVVEAVMQLGDSNQRDSLLSKLEEIVKMLKPVVQKATETEDVILLSILSALGAIGSGTGSGMGIQEATQSLLAAAWIRCGNAARGISAIEGAIEQAGKLGVESFAFGAITKALLRCNSPESLSLLRKLIAKTSRSNPVKNLRAVLGSFPQDTTAKPPPEMLDAVAHAIMALDIKRRSTLLHSLARAYAVAGKLEAVRRYAPRLTGMQLFLFVNNPFLMPEQRLTVAVQQIQLNLLTRATDRSRNRSRLKRSLHWLQQIDEEKTRLEKWKSYVDLCVELQDIRALRGALKVADRLRSEELRTEAMTTMLEGAQKLAGDARAEIRKGVLSRINRLQAESFRSKVLIRLLQTIRANEIAEVRDWAQKIPHINVPEMRAEVLGQLSGTLVQYGSIEDAEDVWMRAAVTDQEACSEANLFATRVSAAIGSEDKDSWLEVLQAADCPDFDVVSEVVEHASNACEDKKRLAILEKKIRGLKRHWFNEGPVYATRFSLARAWSRLNEMKRAAAIASHNVKIGKSDIHTMRYLIQNRAGLVLLLKTISEGRAADINQLAECIAAIPEESWQKQAFRELFIQIIRMSEDALQWRKVESVAILARWLAVCGQPDIARGILQIVLNHKPSSTEWELLQPQGRAAATFQVAKAERAMGETKEAERRLLATITDAAAVKAANFRSDAFSIIINAWLELRGMGSISAESTQRDLELLIQETVQEIPSGFGDKYKPVTSLAIAWADLSEMQKALSITETIESEDQRDEALVELVRRAASWDETIQIWERIFDASARKRAATIIVGKNFQLPYPTEPARASEKWPSQAFRYSVRWNQTYPIALVAVLVPALSYCLLYMLFSFPYMWMAVVALGILFSRKLIWREVQNSVPGRWRVPAFLLSLPFAPIWWGIQLSTKTVDRFVPRIRLWKFIFWRRPPVPRITNEIQWKTAPDLSQYCHFLRFALHESSTFDRLLAPLIYGNRNQTELSELLKTLPPLKLPHEMPESQRRTQLQVEEAERSDRWYNVLRSALRTGTRKLGITLTKVIAFPATALQARYLEKRINQAHQLHLKGNELLNKDQVKGALKVLKRVVKLNPDEPSSWSSYAIALSRDGHVNEALEAYHKAIEKGTGTANEFVYWYNMAYDLFYARRYRDAIEAFQRVVDIAPRNDELYENAVRGIGYCKSNLGIR